MRELKYREAISEALVQAMEADESVFIMGIGVDDPKGIFGTTRAAAERFSRKRVVDTPICEDTMTGVAIGASLVGMRPVLVHARNDFALVSMNELVNHAAQWSYTTGGALHVPITVRMLIGRGWGQGAQHSKSLQAFFCHVPGLKVVMPATPYDAKGLLIASIQENCPVIFIEHRLLYEVSGPVPEEPYTVPLGNSVVRREGRDATIVATSLMVIESLKAAHMLEKEGIDVEVVDLRTVSPMDEETVLASVRKTGRLVIADTGWSNCGLAAEVACRVAEKAFGSLGAPVQRVVLPDVHAPVSRALEEEFYPGVEGIAQAVRRALYGKKAGTRLAVVSADPADKGFLGPF